MRSYLDLPTVQTFCLFINWTVGQGMKVAQLEDLGMLVP